MGYGCATLIDLAYVLDFDLGKRFNDDLRYLVPDYITKSRHDNSIALKLMTYFL